MRNWRWTGWIVFLCIACNAQVKINHADNFQLRRTSKSGVHQLNADMHVHFSRKGQVLGLSELDIKVNGVYLGKSVIAADSQPIQEKDVKLGIRVTFPVDRLVISSDNSIEMDGFMMVNDVERAVHFVQNGISISNLTAQ